MDYDRWARLYDEDTKRFGWQAPQLVVEAIHRYAPDSARGKLRVLDLGVGTGQCSAPFLESGASVVGVDASPAMLDVAAGRGSFTRLVALQLGHGDLVDALHVDKPFDAVMACGVLHFVPGLAGFFRDLAQLVANPSVLAFTTIPPQQRTFGAATRVDEPRTVTTACTEAGFTVASQQRFTAYWDQANEADPVDYTLTVATRGQA